MEVCSGKLIALHKMKNGANHETGLLVLIDSKIQDLEVQLARWKTHRNAIVDAQKAVDLLTAELKEAASPTTPNRWRTITPIESPRTVGLTEGLKKILSDQHPRAFTIPEIRDEISKYGVDTSGKNFYVMLGQAVNRLAKHPELVEVSETGDKKRYSAGKELITAP